MTRKQILIVSAIVLVASGLSALVAYRRGMHQSGARYSAPAAQGASVPCVDFHDAGSHTGENGCISGRVVRVFVSRGGNSFLDFCADFHNCPFTSVIFSSDRSKFGDLTTLRGHEIQIRGPITVYQGRAEIAIHDPDQMRVLP